MTIDKIAIQILVTVFIISGCSDLKDQILTKQVETYDKGKLCISLMTDKVCKEYSKNLSELTNMFNLLGPELFRQASDGDKRAQKIIILADDISKLNVAINIEYKKID